MAAVPVAAVKLAVVVFHSLEEKGQLGAVAEQSPPSPLHVLCCFLLTQGHRLRAAAAWLECCSPLLLWKAPEVHLPSCG